MKHTTLPPPRPGARISDPYRKPPNKAGVVRWEISYPGADGRRCRATFDTKAQADRARAELVTLAYETRALGRPVTRPALTLGALAKLQLERGARKKSARHDAARWPAILAFLGEGRDVSTISSSDVTALRTHLLSLPGRAPRGTRSPTEPTPRRGGQQPPSQLSAAESIATTEPTRKAGQAVFAAERVPAASKTPAETNPTRAIRSPTDAGTRGPDKAPPDCADPSRTEASHAAGTPEEPGKKSPRKMNGRAARDAAPASRASPATANRHLALLRSALQIAIEEKAIAENPVRRGHMLPERARDRIATPDELSRLLAAAKPTLRMAITLACETVLRRGSLAEITWERLDLESRTLTLPDSKSGDPIRVPLSRRATAALEAWPRTSARVIDVHPDTVSHQFAALCRELSIADLTFHDLRHTAATRLMDAGMDWTQVMRLGGWRSVQAFARYRSIRVDTLRVALDRVT